MSAHAASGTPAWLARVNLIRAGAGVKAVSADNSAAYGIHKHLTYLEKTPRSLLTGQYANAHTENPASKYYSAAGAREAGRSNLDFGSSSDIEAINRWLAAPFHAIGMLRSGLTQVGYYRDPVTGYAGLDVLSHLVFPGSDAPVLYPRTTLDVSRFGGELPNPVETCTHAHPGVDWDAAGFPLIAMLPQLTSTDGISAELTEPNGHTISTTGNDLCLVDASTFYSTDTIYGPTGEEILQGDKALLIIPRRPVTAGKYTVHLNLGADYPGTLPTWTFTSHPAAGAPVLQLEASTCARRKHANGSVDFWLTNPLDDAGRATYRISGGVKAFTRSAADGATILVHVGRLAAGKHTVLVTGSDRTHAHLTARVHRC